MGQRAMRTLRVSSFWALSWAIPVASSASILALVAASVAAVSASVLDLASEMAFWASARAAPMMDSALAEISAISPALPFTLESWLRIIPSRSSRVLPTGVNQNLSRNTMRSTNWAAMMGAVRLKSKILPASAEAGMAMSTLASAMVAPLRAAAGTSILLKFHRTGGKHVRHAPRGRYQPRGANTTPASLCTIHLSTTCFPRLAVPTTRPDPPLCDPAAQIIHIANMAPSCRT
mmetsp:Transcript_47655/g.152722  ORF Transcript_47655/g.152722 Transcript_47655/m.152722 type:complete len:233 (+) Transcript_47655:397-1095(+)